MSTDDKEKIIGKLVLEHQAAKEQANLVEERLRGLGSDLLGISLKAGQFDVASQNLQTFRSDIIDLTTVLQLAQEHREATEAMGRLAAKLSTMGVVL